MNFLGAPYPITKHPLGFFRTQSGIDQVKSDLLSLLLTTPGERVMLPEFGTPLKKLMFDPNDSAVASQAREMIIKAINIWEPRITVDAIEVSNSMSSKALNPADDLTNQEHILNIKIRFFDPNNISEIQELKLELPL